MLELLDTQPTLAVSDAEYKRLLGFPADYPLEGRTRELAEQARHWYASHGQPWIYARQTAAFELTSDALQINGARFASKRLHDQLSQAGAHQGILVAVCAGADCEARARELWLEEKPDEYFFLEIFGSAVVEHLVTLAGARLCAWAETNGMAVLPHYSPGYAGWDMADQAQLLRLLRHEQAHECLRQIQALDTGMLQPKKALLALFGLTRHRDRVVNLAELVPCESCSFSPCQYRRLPFRESRPPLEDVRRLQPSQPNAPAPARAALRADAHYSINLRALQKWSQERLQLQPRADGSVRARFRYDGTTCSNLGRPLAFEYQLELAPPTDGYRILQAACAPAPGDSGHTQMCAFLTDPETLMANIAREKPLLGQPLDTILDWSRAAAPSGCYCDAPGRDHKWGLVLEVIHFALAQREKNLSLKPNPPN